MRRIISTIVCIMFFAALPANSQSAPLMQALSTIQQLGDGSFQQLVWWARNPRDPGTTVPDWNNAEHQIMQLDPDDRNAVLSWLTGHGRAALYARGATDALIGGRTVNAAGAPSSATPSPLARYRVLQVTSPSLRDDTPPAGRINVLRGFALITKDGTKAVVCISFTNVAPVAAKSVHFKFPLLSADGATLGVIDFVRNGTFSPNVEIHGPAKAADYFDPGLTNRGIFSNCVTSDQGTAALPLLQARYVAYKVARVSYADGSSWP
jgi:hypothetical protein